MELRRRLLALLFALPILCALCVPASAHEVPDVNKTGSIEVTMRAENTAVPGGTLTLYRVGEVSEDNGDYSFALTADFAGSRLALDDLSADLAQKLAQYAASKSLSGTTKDIGSTGVVKFDNLQTGLYLLVQNEAAKGYNKANPFLVSVPMQEDGKYVYDVDASPKVELEKEPDPAPTQPVKPTRPAKDDSKLPQTGQMNWPIPVLVVLGLGLFSMGWMLRFGKKNGYEK